MSVNDSYNDSDVLARTDVGSEIGDPNVVRASGRSFSGTVKGIEDVIEAAIAEVADN